MQFVLKFSDGFSCAFVLCYCNLFKVLTFLFVYRKNTQYLFFINDSSFSLSYQASVLSGFRQHFLHLVFLSSPTSFIKNIGVTHNG